jgi:hypothetical protein
MRFQNKRDTAANFTSDDPVLLSGEVGFETDTGYFKIGDGSTAWSSLLYAVGAGLTDIEALAKTDGNIIVGDGSNWVAESGATARTSLGLTIGTDVQAYDAGLTSLAGLSYISASFVKMTAADTFALRTIGETADDLEGTIEHDNLSGFVANEHIDHTAVTLTAGTGLTGGGDISANRTFAVDGVLEDLDTLGACSADGEFLVGTGVGALTWESGATVRTSLGLGSIATYAGDQDLATDDSVTFVGLDLTGITNGIVPYMSASGFADSSITANATGVNIAYLGLGLGENYNTSALLNLSGADSHTLGTSQYAIMSAPWRPSSAATVNMIGILSSILTPNESFTTADVSGLIVGGINKGALHTITRAWGIAVPNITSGTNNVLLFLGGNATIATTFTGNYSIYNNTTKTVYLGNASVGINELSPVTQFEMTGTAPYLTLHNSTEENGDGGRECRIIARGEQDGGEETVLGYLELAHDGAADDEKAYAEIKVNDGNDGTTPSISVFKGNSAGIVTMNGLYACRSDGDTGGSGSAGAGNQYVEIEINGTTYKVLHDGTV